VSCGKCGAPAMADSAFCRACGAPLAASGTAADPFALFVGQNYARYQSRWAACDKRGSTYSWNWAAFLFGLFWLAYRKMYLNAGILLGIACLESAATYLFHLPDAAANAMNLALGIVIGMQGNHWYRNHVTKGIADLTATVRPDQLDAALAREGGTNVGAALLAAAVLIAVISVLFAFGEPPPADAIRI